MDLVCESLSYEETPGQTHIVAARFVAPNGVEIIIHNPAWQPQVGTHYKIRTRINVPDLLQSGKAVVVSHT